jgi:type I restriction-modification system DNA methylase subunit
VVEADFFDWPALVPAGEPIIKGIARRLSKFNWSQVAHDVLKALYESVIDVETRHKLGEYYTPDWLAEKMVEESYADPLNQHLLDPACGSGTFLFWAIRELLDACDDAGIDNRTAWEKVVTQISGLDLHPEGGI